MPKASPILPTFDGGELSPLLGGRVDLAKYANGCSVLENFLPMVQGPLVRRGGTVFVSETKASEGRTWLVRFQVSESISYMLEFGGGYIRFYTNRGQLVSGGAPVQVTTPYSWSDLTADDGTCRIRVAQSADTMYIFHIGHKPRKLLRTGADSFSIQEVNLTNGPFKDLNANRSSTVTASAETGTVNLVATQDIFSSGNVGNLFYMEAIDRSAVKPWAVYQEVGIGQRRRVDYRVYQCTAVGAGAKPVTGDLTPTHTEGRAWDGDGVDIADDQRGPIGVEWEYLHSGYGIVRITSVADAKHATGTVVSRLPTEVVAGGGSSTTVTQRDILSAAQGSAGGVGSIATIIVSLPSGHGLNVNDNVTISGTVLVNNINPSDPNLTINGAYVISGVTTNTITINATWPTDYTYSASSNGKATRTVTVLYPNYAPSHKWAHALFSSVEGWPEHGAFWRERLVFARARNIAMSVVGDFENFSSKIDGEVTADSAIIQTLNARQINRIVWIVESDDLILGTNGDEWVIGPIQSSEAVGPGNIRAARRTTYGSRSIQPVEVGGRVLFVQGSGKKVRDYQYDYSSDNYISADVTKLNPGISLSGIIDMTYQQEPDSIIWAARADGLLVGCTYDQELGRSDVYGWHRHPMVNGFVEAVEAMPSPNGHSHDLWMIVRRVVGGKIKRYIEYLHAPLGEDEDQAEAFYVDCGLTYRGNPAATISGLDHLEGQTVDVLTDGAAHPERVVQNGQIELQLEASIVHAGLSCPCSMATMSLEAGSADGTAQGKTKRITNIMVRLFRSLGGNIGGARDKVVTLNYRRPSQPMGSPPPLFTGDKETLGNSGYEINSSIWVTNDQPLPFTLLALMPILHTQDDR